MAASATNAQSEPTLIAPGIVSTGNGEYSPTFDPDRGELYFMRRTPGLFDYTIMMSTLREGMWTEPVVAPFSGEFRDGGPSLSPDGSTLVFDSRRPNPPLRNGSIDLYRVDRTDDGWSDPALVAGASGNTETEPEAGRDEFGPLLTASGDLYFYSFRRPDRDGRHLRVRAGTDAVEHASEVPDPSARTFVGYLTLSADGNLAVIEGRQRSGGGTDLFAARRDDAGRWSEPFTLDRLNTGFGEGTPYLSPDGTRLFFASDRPTGSDDAGSTNLYVVNLHAALGGR